VLKYEVLLEFHDQDCLQSDNVGWDVGGEVGIDDVG
jgi:hypothetical protein